MEIHPEQKSDLARIKIRKKIHAEFARVGHDLYDLAYSQLDLRPLEDILDVGCGLGDFLFKVRRNGHLGKLVGIDRSAGVLEEARGHAVRGGLWVDFKNGEAESLDFPSGSFNCVTALHVIGKADPEKVIAEMGRVLKADGRIVVSTNSRMCYPLLQELKERAKERFGWFLANEWTEGFESETAHNVLRSYFGEVKESRYDDVLQYPDAEVLVDLFRSTRGLWSEELTGAEWERIVDWARDQALKLIPEHGYAEDPTCFSLFLCTAPLGL